MGPGRKSRRPVFSQRGPFYVAVSPDIIKGSLMRIQYPKLCYFLSHNIITALKGTQEVK